MMKELTDINEQVWAIKEDTKAKASSQVEGTSKTQKVDEAEKRIEVAKKGKAKVVQTTLTSTIINMTIEEERKRKARALHVPVRGLKDTRNR